MTDAEQLTVEQAIARVTAVLDQLRAVEAAPRAATTTNGFPGNVAPSELIESAWGNAVAATLLGGLPGYASVRVGGGVFPTNGNGDILLTFAPAFPNRCLALVVVDASAADFAFILKVQNASTSKTTGVVRVFLHDGSKVVNNGATQINYIAYGN